MESDGKAGVFKILWLCLGIVWVIGTGISTIAYEFERKQECVKAEGWFKGVLWCDSDVKGRSTPNSLIKGMLWPIIIFK